MRRRDNNAFFKKLTVEDRKIVRVAWEEPFATLLFAEGSSKPSYMEAAGIEPASRICSERFRGGPGLSD